MTVPAVCAAKLANWVWRAYHARPTNLSPDHELSQHQQQILATLAKTWGDKSWSLPRSASNYNFLTTSDFEWSESPAELVDWQPAEDLSLPESAPTGRLLVVNGKFCPELSTLPKLPDGVIIDSLASAIVNHPRLVMPYLLKQNFAQQPLLAINSLLASDGLFIYLPVASKILPPIHLVIMVNSKKPQPLIQSHNLIILAQHAQLSCITEYVAVNGTDNYFNNVVVDVALAANSVFNCYNLANTAPNARHCVATFIDQGQDSVANIYNASFGGKWSVNNFNIMLRESAAKCQLKGCYGVYNSGQQNLNSIIVDHAAVKTQSMLKFNGVIAHDAHASFAAKVLVQAGAAQACAKQENHNILLHKLATITSKPELEIYAEDVSCRHGATVGQLDAEALFYLQARGISASTARWLLLEAFIASTMDTLDSPYLQFKIQQCWAESIASLL
jgi:Fe-S cluster assembly protein SufD